jgi:hypothetical protein
MPSSWDAIGSEAATPGRLSLAVERQIAGLREATGFGPDRIGALLGLPPSTCHRALGRLDYLDRVRVAEPVVRYEIAEPGGLLHLDTKKLGRLGAGPGHRATGDRTSKRLWRGVFRSVPDLVAVIYAYIALNNADPKPFVWTASAEAILAKVGRCRAILETAH